MKLFVAERAPNPRRVQMFIAEKGITGIEEEAVDLNAQAHKSEAFRRHNPLARVPALVLDCGRVLSETRAICGYLEGLHPEPNLMGRDATEHAFIEMADRQVEWYLMLPIAHCVRHTHPGLAPLERPQFPDFGHAQAAHVLHTAQWLDGVLQCQAWVAGERLSIADITAFCALEFARLMRFKAADHGLLALEQWRLRMADRASVA